MLAKQVGRSPSAYTHLADTLPESLQTTAHTPRTLLHGKKFESRFVYQGPKLSVKRPGIRQALDRDEHRFCSNHFWTVFINSMRVDWPYEFRDCYLLNSATGLYRLSPLFDETLKDIRKIGVDESFFQHYPELENAVNVIYDDPLQAGCTPTGRSPRVDVNGLDLTTKVTECRSPSSEVVTSELQPSTCLGSTPFDQSAPWDLLDSIPEMCFVSNRDFV